MLAWVGFVDFGLCWVVLGYVKLGCIGLFEVRLGRVALGLF